MDSCSIRTTKAAKGCNWQKTHEPPWSFTGENWNDRFLSKEPSKRSPQPNRMRTLPLDQNKASWERGHRVKANHSIPQKHCLSASKRTASDLLAVLFPAPRIGVAIELFRLASSSGRAAPADYTTDLFTCDKATHGRGVDSTLRSHPTEVWCSTGITKRDEFERHAQRWVNHTQSRTTFPQSPDSIASNPFWNSVKWNR